VAVRLDKPWQPTTEAALARLTGQLGVFEFGDDNKQIIFIGCADGRSRFGLPIAPPGATDGVSSRPWHPAPV
jgi:hypothetical protein